jgi:hypothetical protein
VILVVNTDGEAVAVRQGVESTTLGLSLAKARGAPVAHHEAKVSSSDVVCAGGLLEYEVEAVSTGTFAWALLYAPLGVHEAVASASVFTAKCKTLAILPVITLLLASGLRDEFTEVAVLAHVNVSSATTIAVATAHVVVFTIMETVVGIVVCVALIGVDKHTVPVRLADVSTVLNNTKFVGAEFKGKSEPFNAGGVEHAGVLDIDGALSAKTDNHLVNLACTSFTNLWLPHERDTVVLGAAIELLDGAALAVPLIIPALVLVIIAQLSLSEGGDISLDARPGNGASMRGRGPANILFQLRGAGTGCVGFAVGAGVVSVRSGVFKSDSHGVALLALLVRHLSTLFV